MNLRLNDGFSGGIPESIYYHLLFHAWIDFDMRSTGNLETYFDYLESMKFLYKNLDEYKYSTDIRLINYSNFLGVYFKCSRMLDLDALKSMQGTNYTWKKRYRGWTVVANELD